MKALLWIAGIVVAGVVGLALLSGLLLVFAGNVAPAASPERPPKAARTAPAPDCRQYFPVGRPIEAGLLRQIVTTVEKGPLVRPAHTLSPAEADRLLSEHYVGREEALRWLEDYNHKRFSEDCANTIAALFASSHDHGVLSDSELDLLPVVLANGRR